MEKKEFVNILNDVLIPNGFKKKGDNWVVNGDEIIKIINLQKSQFSKSYYINYGYVIKSIPLNGLMMHIFKGFGSVDNIEQNRIVTLLNFENNISYNDRAEGLKKLLLEKLVPDIQQVNTEENILMELKKKPNLNDVPLLVKRHFGLEE